jgi:polyisoprenoid-binding protein YceI
MKNLIFLLFIFQSSIAWAEFKTWVINQDHSELQFKVRYLGLSEVSGRFKRFSGNVHLDDREVPASINIKVDSASLDTANNLRDGHVKGNDFLQTNQYPEISFSSKSITPVSKNEFSASGVLTIKGVTRPFSINFRSTSSIKDTWGYENKFVKFSSKIKRSDFKIKWNKTLADQKYLISDEVTFFGTFQIQPDSTKTPSTKHMLPDTEYVRHRERVARGEEASLDASTVAVKSSISPLKALERRPPLLEKTVQIATEDFRQNILWWAALWTLGLLGFFAVIVMGFYVKNILLHHYPNKYEENGILGYLSDLIVILLVLIYSVAFWFVGWGIR